jgi:iron complex outermembrane receptor protein
MRNLALAAMLILAGVAGLSRVSLAQTRGSDSSLETVLIEADPLDGTASKGYVVNRPSSVGPWTEKRAVDTPYAVDVYTSDFIENVGAQSPADVFKIIPNIQSGVQYVNIFSNFSSRGLWGGGGRDIVNGIQTDNVGLSIFMEDVESMEVLHGLSGFMYGVGNVGGFVNYNLKRPTFDFTNKIRLGFTEGQFSAHFDSGGPIIKDKLAYRFNIAGLSGDTFIDGQERRKFFVSGALDWRISNNIDLLFFGSFGQYKLLGRQTIFGASDTIYSTPDASKLWATDDSFHDLESLSYGTNLKIAFTDYLRFRFGYVHRQADRKTLSTASQFINATNYTYVVTAMNWYYKSDGLSGYFDFDFDTLSLKHKLTVGFNAYNYDRYDARYCATSTSCSATLAASALAGLVPGTPAQGRFPGSFLDNTVGAGRDMGPYRFWERYSGRHHSVNNQSLNFMVGDDIQIGERWGLMAGLSQARFKTKTFSVTTGAQTAQTTATKVTPSLSLIFKPTPEMTAYATWIQSLEAPAVVPSTGTVVYRNAGQLMPAAVSEQYELGFKANAWNMLLTASLFQIDRVSNIQVGPNTDAVMVQDGLNRYRGAEVAVRGRLFDRLNLMTGLTYVDAERKTMGVTAQRGERPAFTPKTIFKLYAEYDAPFLEGLTFTGGLYHTGRVYTTANNVGQLPGVTTFDLGLRFAAPVFGARTVFRLDVTNLADKSYWAFTSGEIAFGAPRQFTLTAECAF